MSRMNRKNLTILVLDDDPDIGKMIRAMLDFRGYDVVVTENSREFFESLESRPVNLVLTDMLLSGDNGTDVCSMLKGNPATSEIPVVMFSAHPNARELCLKAGADAFLAKPFDIQEMYSTVDELATKVPK